jgi:hypothetical protein
MAAAAGCNQSPSHLSLRPWFDADTSISNRVEAVNSSFAAGTPISEIEGILGANGIWFRFHGPTGSMNPDGSYTDHGYTQRWSFVYAFADGSVHINIQNPASSLNATFDKATWQHPAVPIPLSNK